MVYFRCLAVHGILSILFTSYLEGIRPLHGENYQVSVAAGNITGKVLVGYLSPDGLCLLHLQGAQDMLLELLLCLGGQFRIELGKLRGQESTQQHGRHLSDVLAHCGILQQR